MSLEHSYSLLNQPEQAAALEQLNQEIWDVRDRLAAMMAGRAVLMNLMKGEVIDERIE